MHKELKVISLNMNVKLTQRSFLVIPFFHANLMLNSDLAAMTSIREVKSIPNRAK